MPIDCEACRRSTATSGCCPEHEPPPRTRRPDPIEVTNRRQRRQAAAIRRCTPRARRAAVRAFVDEWGKRPDELALEVA